MSKNLGTLFIEFENLSVPINVRTEKEGNEFIGEIRFSINPLRICKSEKISLGSV